MPTNFSTIEAILALPELHFLLVRKPLNPQLSDFFKDFYHHNKAKDYLIILTKSIDLELFWIIGLPPISHKTLLGNLEDSSLAGTAITTYILKFIASSLAKNHSLSNSDDF